MLRVNGRAFKILIETVVLFEIIYNRVISDTYHFVSSERVIVILLFIFVMLKKRKYKISSTVREEVQKMWMFQMFLLIYSALLIFIIGFGSGASILNYLINFLIFVPLEIWCICSYADSLDDVMYALLFASLFQAIVIFFTLFNSGFASFIDNTINGARGAFDFAYMRMKGYPGGIGCITSKGALQLSMGFIPCIYFNLKRRTNNYIYYAIFLFLVFVSTVVSRVSIFIGMVMMMIMLHYSKFNKVRIILLVVLTVIFGVLGFKAYLSGHGSVDLSKDILGRLVVLYKKGLYESFFKGYFAGDTTVIPPLSIETLFGISVVSGESGNGIIINADGGFFRMYAAIGLPLCITFYAVIIRQLKKNYKFCSCNVQMKAIVISITSIFLIGEFKEHFFYSRYLYVIMFVIISLFDRKQSEDKEKLQMTYL